MPAKRTIEQILVEDLGAQNVVSIEKLGEFAVMDGEECGEDFLAAVLNWMKEKRLMHAKSRWTHTAVEASTGESLTIHVYKGAYYTEYRFQPEPEPHAKRFHLIGAFVCVPVTGDAA